MCTTPFTGSGGVLHTLPMGKKQSFEAKQSIRTFFSTHGPNLTVAYWSIGNSDGSTDLCHLSNLTQLSHNQLPTRRHFQKDLPSRSVLSPPHISHQNIKVTYGLVSYRYKNLLPTWLFKQFMSPHIFFPGLESFIMYFPQGMGFSCKYFLKHSHEISISTNSQG